MIKRVLILLSLGFLIASLFSGCGNPKIRVSSFPDPEGTLMAQMIILMLRENGFDVIDAGPYENPRAELENGKVDIFPYYSGYFQALEKANKNPQGNILLKPAPADSRWAIVIPEWLSEADNIRTMSDFAAYVNSGRGKIKLICSPDFLTDEYALDSFEHRYGFTLGTDQVIIVPSYNFVYMWEQVNSKDNDINASVAYTTSGKPEEYGLVLLEDDKKGNEPEFHPAPLVKKEIYDNYAERLDRILTPLFASLDDATLRELNSQIGLFGKEAISEVARKYLMKKGYFKYDELQMVQAAMDEMMRSGGVVTEHFKPTSDMTAFPSPANRLYWEEESKPAYASGLSWPPLARSKTKGTYTCDNRGIVTQVTTGW